MTTTQRYAMWFAIAYVVFWVGGNYSFDYTHECVRSHTEERVDNEGNEYSVTICDFYTANSKRWTFLDPVRAVATSWVTGWVDAAILAGIATAIGAYVWHDRRRERALQEERLAYEAWLRAQEGSDSD